MATGNTANGNVTFGKKLAFSSKRSASFDLTDDKKSFLIRFNPALAAAVGAVVFEGVPKSRSPVSTNVYSAVIPASGGRVKTTIVANGFGSTEAGASTVLILSANGQQSVTNFPPGKDDAAFTASMTLEDDALTDIRVTLVLIARRDAAHPGAAALVAVNDLSVDLALP